jgi:hypothetical protein
MYLFPPVSFMATFASTTYLKRGAKRMRRDIEQRLKDIDELLSDLQHTVS